MNSGLFGALGAAPLRVIGMIKRVIASSPNADVNALQLLATGGSKNVDLVLTPKGNGALLAQIPDGTIANGNKRGTYATDWQRFRDAASKVASGQYATIGGGQSNTVGTGNDGTIGGGRNNRLQNDSYQQTIGGGFGNDIGGGYSSTIGGGEGNYIAGPVYNSTASLICGGISNNIFTGRAVTINGGEGNVAKASYAEAGGYRAVASRYGMRARSAGIFGEPEYAPNAIGNAQSAAFVMRNKTTTNAAVELFCDGASARLSIPSGKAMHATIHIIGIKSDGTVAATYIRQAAIKNVAGTTSLVGDVITIGNDTASGTSISITANDTNDALKIDVTGITSETWRWVATIEGVEVAYGT